MNEHYPFVNPPLPYAYDALEPFLDTKTMELHHDKHLQTYVDNLNNTLKNYPTLQSWSLEQLIYNASKLPIMLQRSIRNNGGGVYNHTFYFNGISNSENRSNAASLSNALVTDFGSYEKFNSEFKLQALAVFGSGYAWLVVDQNKKLRIVTSANQDTPIVNRLYPLLTIDVWEHAYYLKHYNKRADYIDDWFHVVNWAYADELYRNLK